MIGWFDQQTFSFSFLSHALFLLSSFPLTLVFLLSVFSKVQVAFVCVLCLCMCVRKRVSVSSEVGKGREDHGSLLHVCRIRPSE